MTIIGFLILLLVASICGSVGVLPVGASLIGFLTNNALVLIGAFIGSYLSQELGIRDILYLARIPVVWSIVGSTLFVVVLGLLTGRSRK